VNKLRYLSATNDRCGNFGCSSNNK